MYNRFSSINRLDNQDYGRYSPVLFYTCNIDYQGPASSNTASNNAQADRLQCLPRSLLRRACLGVLVLHILVVQPLFLCRSIQRCLQRGFAPALLFPHDYVYIVYRWKGVAGFLCRCGGEVCKRFYHIFRMLWAAFPFLLSSPDIHPLWPAHEFMMLIIYCLALSCHFFFSDAIDG